MISKILSIVVALLLILAATTLNSCKKEEKDPCDGVTCLNGGNCVNGHCDCPEGYTGSDCSNQDTPSKILISKVKVTKFPTYNNGSDWDIWSAGPDIYIALWDGSSYIYVSQNFFEDADPTSDYTFNISPALDLSDVLKQYQIVLFDYDSTSDDEFMGGVSLYPYSNTGGFPTTLYIDGGGSVAFEMTISYAW
jgi:hypothetical protein